MQVPAGPGVRWDGGYEAGDEVSQFYDNLVGKLVVWAGDRDKAIARMLRALDEFEIEGIATTKPADIAILSHPDFAAATHSTKWVEETLDLSGVEAAPITPTPSDDGEAKVRRDVDVEVNGRRYSVAVWVPDVAPVAATAARAGGGGGGAVAARPRRSGAATAAAAVGGSGKVTVPMQGTITKVLVAVGDTVEAGQPVCVLEAMKMENNINADKSGTVAEVKVSPGQSVGTGDIVIVIE
jgi:acetyl-CoA/propionyl-CoA carboxylase biotin carboxyl carrier protein